ncbi:hypothetical protein RSAG8_09973, partial [Rhizoctonia solani AG-8 WAC10335]
MLTRGWLYANKRPSVDVSVLVWRSCKSCHIGMSFQFSQEWISRVDCK